MNGKTIKECNYTIKKRNGQRFADTGSLLIEHHLQIIINKEYILEAMCSSEYLEELVVGRLLTEGVIRTEDDIVELKFNEEKTCVHVEMEKIENCQVKEVLPLAISDEQIFRMADRMADGMPLHEVTWGTHSCFLYQNGKLLFSCEDIGRHNAVDKVIGHALMHGIDLKACAIYTSGRVPSDMVEKAIAAGVPVLVSKGVPTLNAVELAQKNKLTLICGARRDQMKIYTDFRKKKMDVLILAGGKNRRMNGQYKGKLKFGEETFDQHLVRELQPIADEIWFSYGMECHNQQENCNIVTDIYKDCGPLGGLHAGMAATAAEYVFVTACDMPFVQTELVEYLKQYLTDDVDAVVPRADDKTHALAAIYRSRILPVLEEQLECGDYKMRNMLEQIRVKYVDIQSAELKHMLRNVNTMEEYLTLNKR